MDHKKKYTNVNLFGFGLREKELGLMVFWSMMKCGRITGCQNRIFGSNSWRNLVNRIVNSKILLNIEIK